MNTTPNVAAKIDELLQRVDELTTADKVKPTTFNAVNAKRAEAIAAADEAASNRRRSVPGESAWLADSSNGTMQSNAILRATLRRETMGNSPVALSVAADRWGKLLPGQLSPRRLNGQRANSVP